MPAPTHLDPFPWLDVVIILLLVALNGVFAMSELAIVSSRRPRLRAMAKTGRKGAQAALDLASDPGRFLSTVQIGITLVGIVAGAYGGATLARTLGDRFADWGWSERWADVASRSVRAIGGSTIRAARRRPAAASR